MLRPWGWGTGSVRGREGACRGGERAYPAVADEAHPGHSQAARLGGGGRGNRGCGLAGCGHPAAGSMLALSFTDSPIKFRVVTCGPLSPAQQAAAHTRARNGVVIRATNTGTVAMMPTFTVEFYRGHKHKWDGTNYTSRPAR